MRRVGNLFEQVVHFRNLEAAAHQAARGKQGRQEVALFFFNLEPELLALKADLENGVYRPGPFRVFRILDPKERLICAAPFRDRVLHHAVCNFVEPVFERGFIQDSYACRKGFGSHRALRRAQQYLRRHAYFLKLDVKSFFHSIDHEVLKTLVRRKIKDPHVLDLLDRIIEHRPPGFIEGRGLPIGNLTSQHFANLYLDAADHFIKEELRVPGYVRYMDDMLLFADEKATLRAAEVAVEGYLHDKLHLALKEKARILSPADQGLPFLGFRLYRGTCRVLPENWRRFKRRFRQRDYEYEEGRLDEAPHHASVRSMLAYLQHGDTRNLRAAFLASR